ncbi:HNH endonuclease [Streptomyces sp. LARHCF249]
MRAGIPVKAWACGWEDAITRFRHSRSRGGSSHPRNGLPMDAPLHRTVDAGLFAIDPVTHEVHALPGGTTKIGMGAAAHETTTCGIGR